MTTSAAGAAPPPCSADPERWFDRAQRTHALSTCLECPVRRWCAGEALRIAASWGMWAGIWIDGRIDEVAHFLHAIAEQPACIGPTVVEIVSCATHSADDGYPLPRTRLDQKPSTTSVAAALLARSSGHCEVFSDSCGSSADVHVSRIQGRSIDEVESAAEAYAACKNCAYVVIPILDADEARRLGFVVDAPALATGTPLRWRGAHWVLLDRWGRLAEVNSLDAAIYAC